MKVIILSAGEGVRIKNKFPNIPKGLIPVNGKPMVEHLIERYRNFEILINVRSADADKFRYLKKPLLVEKSPLGNAGAIKFFIEDLGNEFIVTHNDVYSDLNPHKLAEAHKKNKSIATMVVKDLSNPKEFGVITYTNNNLVTGFTRERLTNCGIYIFSKEIADYIGEGFQDFDRDLFPKLIAKRRLHFYRHEGKWQDIGCEGYWKTRLCMRRGK